MQNDDTNLYDWEVPYLLHNLVQFLGEHNVEQAFEKYNKGLQLSAPIYRDQFLKTQHPWFDSWNHFREFAKTYKPLPDYAFNQLLKLAADARKVLELQVAMPPKVRSDFQRVLLDPGRASDYLLELDIAWHYHVKGYTIEWHEDSGKNRPEFTVHAPNFIFDVECKKVGIDSFRNIQRSTFYNFMDILIPKIEKFKVRGKIEFVFDGRLPSDVNIHRAITDKVVASLKSKQLQQAINIDCGFALIDLVPTNNKVVNPQKLRDALVAQYPAAHIYVYSVKGDEGQDNPVSIICLSKSRVSVVSGIYKKLNEGIKRQLTRTRPGLVVCYLPEIDDFTPLLQDSALEDMTTHLLFAKRDKDHIAAIVYVSEPNFQTTSYGQHLGMQGAVFINANCRFEVPEQFTFLNMPP